MGKKRGREKSGVIEVVNVISGRDRRSLGGCGGCLVEILCLRFIFLLAGPR